MKTEFEDIIKDIINNDKYKALANETHHGLTRYDHSIRVAKGTYKIAKKMGIDYVSATRAAMLHDFFVNEDFDSEDASGPEKLASHASLAVANAKKHFNINAKEENAILTHMFPVNLKIPNSMESAVVNIADKGVSLYECSRFKLAMTIGVWALFVFNVITFSNK